MKSLYNKAKHSFQEQQIPLPDQRDYVGNDKGYAEAYHAYAHQQPTRTIACRPGDVWEEGRLYEEAIDYVVSEGIAQEWDPSFFNPPDDAPFEYYIVKIPQPPAQEAELWKDLMKKIFGISSFFDKPMEELFEKEIADLQTKYRLSLKSEQPEAIEFANFLLKNSMGPNGFGGWGQGEINVNYYGSKTEDLYQLFKQKK